MQQSKQDLQGFGKAVVQLQQKALDAVTAYFSLEESDPKLTDARQAFVRSYVDAYHVEGLGTLTVQRMIRYRPRGTLHLHIQMESPLIVKDWAEIGNANNSLDYYFAELRTTVLDSYRCPIKRDIRKLISRSEYDRVKITLLIN